MRRGFQGEYTKHDAAWIFERGLAHSFDLRQLLASSLIHISQTHLMLECNAAPAPAPVRDGQPVTAREL